MENVKNIYEIFFKGVTPEKQNIIKTVNIDENIHKRGVLNIFKSLVNNFTIDENNKNIITSLFKYFTGNELYCTENNIDLNKGILLTGNVGTGKSVLFHAFKLYTGQILMKNSFQYYNASEIIDTINVSGIGFLEKFNTNNSGEKVNPITCYIDDLASKNEKVKNYGTEISVMDELISIRYNIYKKYNKLTHFSTNISLADFQKYYDIRIIDRLIEMCNFIELNGISRRK